jgi:hypothetical protein
MLSNPLLPNPCCAPYTLPLQHPCYPPTMSHSKPLNPVIIPTLHDHPRTNLVPWKIAINRAARGVFAVWDAYGFLFGVCDDAVLAITDTLNLTPRDIITAMTLLHGTVTGAEVDLLHLPLNKKLSSLADLPAHIVLFRGHLARLTTAGQALLDLDAYRCFLASLSSFPVFHQYTLLFTVANGAI